MTHKLKLGDSVVATKYHDGDSEDHFCVGFYAGRRNGRHYVIDDEGRQFRAGGFRRVAKVTEKRARVLVANLARIAASGRSVWYFVRLPYRYFL